MLYLVRLVACLALIALALFDLRARRLPNGAVLAVAGLYIVFALLSHAGRTDLPRHLAMGAFVLALCALFFRFGWLGGGDAKFAAAIFLWAGPLLAVPVLLIVSLSGLMLGLMLLAIRACYGVSEARLPSLLLPLAPARGVPYGVALALGGLAAVWMPLLHHASPA
ncbi:prepilin peptidase [Pandoraea sp.]|uniref:prepilin peptidase n=1 Tax=Pandoraea sp. TaxID=1883445 RepID=UPI0011F5091A|nr:prepilin peptidase [Pandoraea sp.]TAL53354.1 MAG: peptidase A24 [Pandoraea sp.]TAM20443.1 MAG: peptidase A24 [Pandoraea sp.]